MNTIGELIDTLLESETDCMWLRMVCRHTDADTMVQFRALPIVEENMLIFSNTIAAQIRVYLEGVGDEERFESILKDGHAIFGAAWELVKDSGIPKESVDVPISYGEMAAQVGIVSINDGVVTLTDKGEKMARTLRGEG